LGFRWTFKYADRYPAATETLGLVVQGEYVDKGIKECDVATCKLYTTADCQADGRQPDGGRNAKRIKVG
jgi:hypothetical protein